MKNFNWSFAVESSPSQIMIIALVELSQHPE